MSMLPEVRCGWCKAPATDPSTWMNFGRKSIPLCSACFMNIRQVLKAGNFIAKELGRKLRKQ